jgi:hypothetical protein
VSSDSWRFGLAPINPAFFPNPHTHRPVQTVETPFIHPRSVHPDDIAKANGISTVLTRQFANRSDPLIANWAGFAAEH